MTENRIKTRYGTVVEVIRLMTTDPTLVWCNVPAGGNRWSTTFIAREDLVPAQLVDQLVGGALPVKQPTFSVLDDWLDKAAKQLLRNIWPTRP